MALTELKSDLSKFRRPIERPIIENQSVEITRKSNLTPISNLSTGITSPTPLKETPTKSVVTPKPFDTTEKFKGQTTPNNFEFSPEFTTPKLSNVDFFPNTNADGFTARMRESHFNFSSLSSPTPMTLEGKFLGETDPNRLSLESKFLGQTTPTPVDNTEKFKGQTTPNEVDNTEKFKGQTTPNEVDDTEKFKGQTTPTNFAFTPQFTATTPTNFTFTPQFTATTPTNFTFTPQFTTPNLGNVDFIPNIDAKGFTSKIKQVPSQFVGINRDQSIFTGRTLNSQLGLVNFFPNDDGVGFTKNFVDKTKSQFTGISGETFTSPKVTFGGDFGLSFLPGNKIKLEGSAAKYYGTGNQKWQPGGKRYEDNYVSIGDLLIRENSPSYLTKVYGQFNLQDDSFNPYPLFFRQPFILRGIQRKNKKEPQKWGLGLSIDSIMGVDLIRGGVVTSTERALVDVARIGQFILSPKGLVWSVMQVGMQRTNRYNKVWTPINLLAAVGGQHIGLKPKRHGLLPFGPDNGNYENFVRTGYKTKLEELLKEIQSPAFSAITNDEFLTLKDGKGGPDSVYGIGNTTYTRSTSKLIKVPGVENFDTFGKNKPQLITDNNEFLNYSEISDFSKKLGEKKTKYNDFRSKYKDKPLMFPGKKSSLDAKIRHYKDNPDGKYYEEFNIEKKFGFANSDATIGKSYNNSTNTQGPNTAENDYDDLIPLIFQTIDTRVQFRGTVNSISETFTPNWTEIKYSGRAENAYLYDTFTRELNFGFRVYAYSVGELQPMWVRLEKLGKMTMPTYVSSGYRGNITKFTLGTMYKNFPALISSLQYAIPDEFTWEIGLNQGASDNVLPMGVDVTIGLKLLNKTLHNTADTTKIYDFERSREGVLGTTMEDIQEMRRTAVGTLAL